MACPTFLILSTDSIILIILNSVLQRYGGPGEGDVLVTCATIVQSWFSLISLPMGGITTGSQPVVSFNYGAHQPDRIKRAIFCIAVLCVVFCSLMTAAAHTGVSALFVRLFTQDRVTASRTVGFIRVFTAMIIPLAVQYTLVDELTAMGQVHISLICSPVPQEPVPGQHIPAAPLYQCGGHILVRAHRRRRRGVRHRLCVCLRLPQGNQAPHGRSVIKSRQAAGQANCGQGASGLT